MEDGNRTNLATAVLVGMMLIVGGFAFTASASAASGSSATEGFGGDGGDPCIQFDDDPVWVTVHPSCITGP